MREGRQFLRYTFFKLLPSWREASKEESAACKSELKAIIERYSSRIIVKAFSLLGTRGDVDFMLWTISERLEDFRSLCQTCSKPHGQVP